MTNVSRWFRFLIALHPCDFRERFRHEMADAVAEAMRGRRPLSAQWWFLSGDLIKSAARERAASFSATAIPVETDQHLMSNGARMGNLLQDLRYAIRSLSRVPGFTATVIISLALGIGANTLVYSLVDSLVLRPFAYPDAERLVAVGVRYADDNRRHYIESLSPAEFEDIRGLSKTLDRFFAFDLGNRNISGGDQPERLFTAFLYGDPFVTIGLRPYLGRGFTTEETTTDQSSVAILSYRIWATRFGADSGIVGKAIRVNGAPRTVVGVMPPNLLIMGTDLWLPLGTAPGTIPRQARNFAIVARVRDGVGPTEVQTDLTTVAATVARTWEGQHKEYRQWSLAATPWAEVVSAPMRPASLVMLGTVVFVLLLACANIASLMLARASVRQRELSVRAALGARTPRLARQLMTESLLLSLAGGGLGVALAVTLIGPASSLFPNNVASLGLVPALRPQVLLATLAVTVIVGLLTSIAPVARLARQRGLPGLASAGRTRGGGRADRRVRQAFTIAQVAFALVLVSGATVMLRSMKQLGDVDPGIATDGLLTMRLSLSREQYKAADVGPFFESLSQRLAAIPGVLNAAATTQFPPMNGFDADIAVDGGDASSAANRSVDVTNTTETFAATLGMRLLSGRTFTATDRADAPRVAVLNATAVRRYLGGGNALGRRVGLVVDKDTVWHEVVGVVSDARNHGLDVPTAPEVFVPVRQQQVAWNSQLFLLVRTKGEPLAMLPAIRETIRSIDAQQPVYAIRTMRSAFADSIAPRRAASVLLAAFAGIALLLAAVGIYGILSYLVSARTHEIGVRMALGANERSVVGLVLRETAWLLGIGCVIGAAGVIAMRGLISGIAFEVQPTEPLSVVTTLAAMAATALVAGLVPTRRAVRVTPVEALREEG